MSRMVLIVVSIVAIALLGGFAALGLTAHPPVPQPVHRDLPLPAPPAIQAAPTLAVPDAPVITPVVPAAPAQPPVQQQAPAHP